MRSVDIGEQSAYGQCILKETSAEGLKENDAGENDENVEEKDV